MEEQSRFERQLNLENEYQSYGYKKVAKADQKNKENLYGSHSSFGNLIRQELVGYLADYLKGIYKQVESGKTGIGYQDLHHAFAGREVNWPRISHIGLATLLDYLFYSDKSMSTVNLRIGQRIQDDLRLRFFMKADEDLYKSCKRRYMRPAASYRQKVYSTKKVFGMRSDELKAEGDYSLDYQHWTETTCRKVGAWITAAVQDVFKGLTNQILLAKKPIPGKGKSIDWAYCLDESLHDLEANNQIQSALKGNYQDNPMVCQPIDWSLDCPGGFVTNAVTHRYPLIRGRGTTIPSATALDALNRLQRVPWRINEFVLEQFNYFFERGESVNNDDPFKPFLQPEEHEIPKLPPHLKEVRDPESATNEFDRGVWTDQQEERKALLRELTTYYNNLAERRKNGRIHQLVWMAANQFAKEDRFWIPWSFDFRTRMYPISILNPQSANHINGLMEFADGHPIDSKTEYWLSVHVATTKGFSKETFEGRVEWVRSHHREITLVATDPLGEGRRYWTEEADEPWTYLAACREFYEIFIAKTRNVTHTPCGLDATASGLQILGGLMGDESTCQLVNVLPTTKPSDLYQAVIDKTIQLIKEDRPRRRNLPLDQLTRKVAKAPTMTLAYGSTPWRRKKQVQEACNGKRGLALGLKWDKIAYITDKLDEAIGFVLPGVTFTLRWLQEVAVASMNQSINPGKTMVLWTTPAGSEIHQRYFKSEFTQVKTIALGMTKYHRPRVYKEGDEFDLSKVESSTAANFVHSLDASILQQALNGYEAACSVTHDCFYARAGNELDELSRRIKTSFIQVVSSNCLENFAVQNGVATHAEEVKNKRNTNFIYDDIKRSKFLFC